MRLPSVGVLVLSVSACAAPSPSADAAIEDAAPARYAPLVCDPAAAAHVAFAAQETSDWFGPATNHVHGKHFLIVDGSCRYFVASRTSARLGEVRTGMLTATQLDALNAELLTGPWETIDGEHLFDPIGADSSSVALWRDDLGASCYYACGTRSSELLRAMFVTAFEWEATLDATAEPMTGPVMVSVQSAGLVAETPGWAGPDWPGSTSLAPGTSTVEDATEAAALRALRVDEPVTNGQFLVRDGDRLFSVSVTDLMPHSGPDGRFRPPFLIHT